MARRTKAQKRRLCASMMQKGVELFTSGHLNAKDVDAIRRIKTKALRSIDRNGR